MEDIDLSEIKHEDISVEKLTKQIKFDLSIIFILKSQEKKNFQLFYSAATALVYVFDLLTFCIAFYEFQGVPGYEHADVVMLTLTMIFLSIDAYYFMWVLNLKSKLPPDMAAFATDAVLGYSNKVKREIEYNLDIKQQPNADQLLEKAKNKMRQKMENRENLKQQKREEAKKIAQEAKNAAAKAKGDNKQASAPPKQAASSRK